MDAPHASHASHAQVARVDPRERRRQASPRLGAVVAPLSHDRVVARVAAQVWKRTWRQFRFHNTWGGRAGARVRVCERENGRSVPRVA